jgi:hypothetical protein
MFKGRGFLFVVLMLVLAQPGSAQLLPQQRLHDFENLVALFSKRYAPYDWKKQAVAFDLFDIEPWLARVKAAKDDLEFFEIQAEYVARLQDTHAGFSMTSSFRADLGMTVDIYDGRVLIDSINRVLLPASRYPFGIGDEIVSVDGVSAEDWISRISTWRKYGNPVSTRRIAAAQITVRSQTTFPRAIDIGDVAKVEIRRANGVTEYSIPWNKTGIPVRNVGPARAPATIESLRALESRLESVPEEMHNYRLPENDLIIESLPWVQEGGGPRKYVTGIGARTPLFTAGFPGSFVQRLGRLPTDFHFSGTYTSSGLAIGYLRVPTFSPPATAVAELRNEIDFLQRNTDGLVVDVMRNPGGGCYMLDLAATLTPYPFYFFGEQIRATQDRLNGMQALLDLFRARQAVGLVDQRAVDTYQIYVDEMKAALSSNRGMTKPIPACTQSGQLTPPVMNDNAPAPVVYTKPVIVLIDDFSISAADIFSAMMQDNRRALLVGTRGSGGGGSASAWPTGFYSESISNNTNTLVVRKKAIVTNEYPTAPFVENIGPRADIPLDYMTRDNLLNGGRPFVEQFTAVIVDQIRKTPGPMQFVISNFGSVSWSTPGTPGGVAIGYARIEPDVAGRSPNGLAVVGLRQRNVLVSEAALPATPAIQLGRIYVELGESVNTAIAIANPNVHEANIQFYFTDSNGDTVTRSMTIAPNGQISKFLSEAPFNGAKPLIGTFTFNSSVPVAVVAARALTNERNESLLTTLPVTDISRPAATGPVAVPHYVDGNGWTTQLVLLNPTDSPLTGTVQFFNSEGSASTIQVDGQANTLFTYAIPARGVQKLNTSGSPGSVQTGSVRVVPALNSPSPAGLAILNNRQRGITISEAGAPVAVAGDAFRFYVEATGDFARGLIGSVQSGFAISNASSVSVSVKLELRRIDGSPTGLTATLLIPPRGQVSRFIYQIPELASVQLPFQGVLRITSAAQVSVMGLRGRLNERNDFLFTSTPPVNEGSTVNPALFFPHFADGGGYRTEFILFSGSPSEASSGQLRFVEPSGAPLNLTLR